jgi:hypothetical protein
LKREAASRRFPFFFDSMNAVSALRRRDCARRFIQRNGPLVVIKPFVLVR